MIQCADHLSVKIIATNFVQIVKARNDERYEHSVFDTQYSQDVYQVISRCVDSNIESDRNYYDC